MIPIDERELECLVEETYRAERLFFNESATQTASGEFYGVVLSLNTAVRRLVDYIRDLNKNQ